MAPHPVIALIFALQASSPSEDFERGRTAFERGEFGRAIQLLRPLLYPVPRLRTEGEVVQTHRMLGVSHIFEKQPEDATREFRKLLQLRPDFRMDTLLDPPQVVEFFNGILKQQEAELAELEEKRRAAEAEERRRADLARPGAQVVERRIARNSFALNFLPFGAGQFQNGHRAKGWAFLTAEALFGAVSVGALATNFGLYGVRPRIRCVESPTPSAPGPSGPATTNGCPLGSMPGPEERNSTRLRQVQVVSGALFFATAAWGILDAIWHFRPEVPLDGGASARLQLYPTVFGEGAGALGGALGFRF